ncbi:MAG: SGNH/GDSL hydrolase family protein [Lachnospiraceae bacterium]|nr:SGNH/GDSL hydrolase family protein [Lachnospiraceae bacterium]
MKFLAVRRLAKMPGNAPQYNFDTIEPMENSPLAGKGICVLGSSVVYGSASLESAVGEYLAARFGCSLTKEAVSGTTLANSGKSSYIQRMQNNINSAGEMDLFICQLSTNDATQKQPLGVISDSMELDDFDTVTVTGAMEYIICYARQTWNCPIVFFTGSHYEDDEYDAMVERLHELEIKWDIGVLDLWSDGEFNMLSEEERMLYMSDNIHPTKAGYREWWGPEMERQLIEYLGRGKRDGFF